MSFLLPSWPHGDGLFGFDDALTWTSNRTRLIYLSFTLLVAFCKPLITFFTYFWKLSHSLSGEDQATSVLPRRNRALEHFTRDYHYGKVRNSRSMEDCFLVVGAMCFTRASPCVQLCSGLSGSETLYIALRHELWFWIERSGCFRQRPRLFLGTSKWSSRRNRHLWRCFSSSALIQTLIGSPLRKGTRRVCVWVRVHHLNKPLSPYVSGRCECVIEVE